MDGMATGSKPHLFTVADYHRMSEIGLFQDTPRVELIQGQIIDMVAIGSPHFGMVNRLNRLLVPRSGRAAWYRCRTPSGSTGGPSRSRTLPFSSPVPTTTRRGRRGRATFCS